MREGKTKYKKPFSCCEEGDLEAVRQILDKAWKINTVSGDKPKEIRDDRSLQVAYQIGTLNVQTYLLIEEAGIEEPTELNPLIVNQFSNGWTSCIWLPAHDQTWNGQYEMYSSKEKADRSFKVFEKCVGTWVDISQKRQPWWNFVANYFNRKRQEVLPSYYWKTKNER